MERQAAPTGGGKPIPGVGASDGADSPLEVLLLPDGQQSCTTCRTILSK